MDNHPGQAFFQQVIESNRQALDHANQREQWMIGTLLTGGEATLFGKRVRVHIEWPDGLPMGMAEWELRQMGEEMLREGERHG